VTDNGVVVVTTHDEPYVHAIGSEALQEEADADRA
jgi:hypothetical protein